MSKSKRRRSAFEIETLLTIDTSLIDTYNRISKDVNMVAELARPAKAVEEMIMRANMMDNMVKSVIGNDHVFRHVTTSLRAFDATNNSLIAQSPLLVRSLEAVMPIVSKLGYSNAAIEAVKPVITHQQLFNSMSEMFSAFNVSEVLTKDFVSNLSDALSEVGADDFDVNEESGQLALDELSDADKDSIRAVLSTASTGVNDNGLTCKDQIIVIQEQKPKLMMILQYILVFLNMVLFFGDRALSIAQNAAPVREQPYSTSTVVNNITINQQFFVVDSVPYYYQIRYQDPETNEIVDGYIYKGAAKPVEWIPEIFEEDNSDYKDAEVDDDEQ